MPLSPSLSHLLRLAAAISLTALLSGCASQVPFYDVPYTERASIGPSPNASSISQRILCELADIAELPGISLAEIKAQNIVAVAELSLTVTDDGALAPSATYTNGLFSFMGGVKFDQSRAQNFTEDLVFPFAEIRGNVPKEACVSSADTNLAGDLGLRYMWALANSSGPYADWSQKPNGTGAFGGSITFTVDKELTATGPTWKLKHFTGPGSFLTAYDKNIDKLTVGFARGKGAAAAAQDAINKVKQNQQTDALQTIANSKN